MRLMKIEESLKDLSCKIHGIVQLAAKAAYEIGNMDFKINQGIATQEENKNFAKDRYDLRAQFYAKTGIWLDI